MGQQSKQVGCPSKLTNELIAKAKEYLYGGYCFIFFADS